MEEAGVGHSFKKSHRSKREHWYFKRESLEPFYGRRKIHNVSLRGSWGKPVPKVAGGYAFGKGWLYLAGMFSEMPCSGSEGGQPTVMNGQQTFLSVGKLDLCQAQSRYHRVRGACHLGCKTDKASIPSVTCPQREAVRAVGIQRKEQVTLT